MLFLSQLGEIYKCCYRPLRILFFFSPLYPNDFVHTNMCINSCCSDTCQDIQTLTDQNDLLCVVPQVLLLTWGGCSQVLLGPVFFVNLFWLEAFFETKISRKTFCTFLFPICLFSQRTQSSGHKKENSVKVRS